MEEDSASSSPGEAKKRSFKWLFKLLPYLIVLGIGFYLGTYLVRQKPTWFGLPQGTAQAQAEVDALVAKVSKLMTLPTDETPTVATVTDISKVQGQPFFANAKNGDKVLIYQKAGKAILFRESENKIIEVGAINFNQPVVSPVPSEETTPTSKAQIPAATPSPTPSQ